MPAKAETVALVAVHPQTPVVTRQVKVVLMVEMAKTVHLVLLVVSGKVQPQEHLEKLTRPCLPVAAQALDMGRVLPVVLVVAVTAPAEPARPARAQQTLAAAVLVAVM